MTIFTFVTLPMTSQVNDRKATKPSAAPQQRPPDRQTGKESTGTDRAPGRKTQESSPVFATDTQLGAESICCLKRRFNCAE